MAYIVLTIILRVGVRARGIYGIWPNALLNTLYAIRGLGLQM